MTGQIDNSRQLPKGWIWTKLKEISEKITDGTHFTPTYMDKGISFISVKDVFDGKISFDNCKYISEEEHNSLRKRCNPENLDVLITKSGTIGRTAVVKTYRPFSLFVSVALIKPYKKYMDSDFIAFSLENYINSIDIQQSVKGGVIKNLHIEDLKEISIPLPPFSEQRRIVTKIEELFTRLDAGVESLRKVKAQLRRYRQAVLNYAFEGKLTKEWRKTHRNEIEDASIILEQIKVERINNEQEKYNESLKIDTSIFTEQPEGWVWSRVGKVISIIDYRGRTPPYSLEGIPHLRSSNIKNGKIIWNDLRHVSEETFERYMTRGLPDKGDLLFTTEAPLGDVAFVPEMKFSVAQRLMILKPNKEILNPKFLYYQLMCQSFQTRLKNKGTGTTVTGVSSRNFRPVLLVVSPLIEQQVIVNEIDRRLSFTDEIENIIENSFKKAERVRKSILKKAFEGKLIPQDPTDESAEKLLERIKKEKARGKVVESVIEKVGDKSDLKQMRLM